MNREEILEDEAKYPWLKILLDTYKTSDLLVAENLKCYSAIGCEKGCSSCCENPTVPFTEPELMGISWFASEKLREPLRSRVKERLYAHDQTSECPFLVERTCSIYPVRPLICRQFYVKGRQCERGEDPARTRPEDMISPNRTIAKVSSMRLLEFWGAKTMLKKERMFAKGFMVENSRHMHNYDWSKIAETMGLFDGV